MTKLRNDWIQSRSDAFSQHVGPKLKELIFPQLCRTIDEVFRAAAGAISLHLQLLPNAFKLLGLDSLVDGCGKAWLLEIGAAQGLS